MLYQFIEVWRYFCELKAKPCKGFESTKWLRHFVLWYNTRYLIPILQIPATDKASRMEALPVKEAMTSFVISLSL